MNQKRTITLLPKDWKWVKLGDVCEIIMGQSPPSSTYNTDGIGLPFFQGKAEFTELHPIVEKWCSTPNKIAKPNDILLSVRAPVGATNVADRDCCIGRGLAAIRYKNWKYVFYFLNSIEKQLDKQGTGTTFKAISGEIIRETEFPFPDQTTQQTIVSKIEELFSELDKGIEQLKTAQRQLKTYRQAVLKCAFEGKLTTDFNETKIRRNFQHELEIILNDRKNKFNSDLVNAKKNKLPKPRTPKNIDEKFKVNHDHLNFVGNIPKDWSIINLAGISSDLPDAIVDGPFGSSINVEQDYVDKGVPVIRVNNILPMYFERHKLKFIRHEKFNDLKRHNVISGDVLFGKVGTIGNSCIYPIGEPEAMLSTTGSCRIRVDDKIILNKFLCYYLNSQKHNFNTIASAAVQAFLNMETINNFPIPICSIEEQHKIIHAIESRLSVADKIEETITQSLQQAEALRQSILKMAFEGRLVTTDTIETIKQAAKSIPSERKILAGKIIHLLHKDKYFGLTKFQKILYLVENFAEMPYETNFIQERAGPYDKDFTTAFRTEMREKDWIQEELKGSITKFLPGNNIGPLIEEYTIYFSEKSKQIDFIIQQLKDKSTHDAELIATLYAVWNNRLIKKKPVKVELLVEDFFNWSTKKKEEFQQEEVLTTYSWMKKTKLIPSGFGKAIGPEA